jgi:hypothetical protein
MLSGSSVCFILTAILLVSPFFPLSQTYTWEKNTGTNIIIILHIGELQADFRCCKDMFASEWQSP